MELKPAYATLLALAALVAPIHAATTTAAPESESSSGEESSSSSSSSWSMPPASSTCFAANFVTGGDFLDCCPAPDANDGICTIVWCLIPESLTIRDSCNCGQVETACDQLSLYTSAVDGLSEACTAMSGCCETGVTSNSDFASCTEDAIAMSNITIPDVSSLVPGGVPDLDAVSTTMAEATTAATEAGDTTDTTGTEGSTETTTTAAPETEAAATGADKGTSTSGAKGYHVVDVAHVLIGTSFAMLFV